MDYDCGMRLSLRLLVLPLLLAAPGLAAPAAGAPTAAAPALPAVGTPEWIVDSFFKQKEFPELARYATGEFAELYKSSPTLGSIVPAAVTVSTRVLERDALQVVFGVTMTDSNVTKE